MTIYDYLIAGNDWMNLKGVPLKEDDSDEQIFIHNKFFEGKYLEEIQELINYPKKKGWNFIPDFRVYGGTTPDAEMVGWIYPNATILETKQQVNNN